MKTPLQLTDEAVKGCNDKLGGYTCGKDCYCILCKRTIKTLISAFESERERKIEQRKNIYKSLCLACDTIRNTEATHRQETLIEEAFEQIYVVIDKEIEELSTCIQRLEETLK